MKNNSTCKDFLIEAMKYHLLPAEQRRLMETDRTRPRTPVSLPKVGTMPGSFLPSCSYSFYVIKPCPPRVRKVMMVVGGQAPKAIRGVECYDLQEDRWYQGADLPSRRCRAGKSAADACFGLPVSEGSALSWMPSAPAGVVFMAGRVYAVGGFNGSLRVRTVDAYDGAREQWGSVCSMQERRSTLGAAVLGDLLYAVGGFDGSTGMSPPPLGRQRAPHRPVISLFLLHSVEGAITCRPSLRWSGSVLFCALPTDLEDLPCPPRVKCNRDVKSWGRMSRWRPLRVSVPKCCFASTPNLIVGSLQRAFSSVRQRDISLRSCCVRPAPSQTLPASCRPILCGGL